MKPIVNDEACAKDITETANKWEARKYSQPEIADAYKDDADDLREVAALVLDGKIEMAWQRAKELDTIVREFISQPSWDYLSKQVSILGKTGHYG